MNHRIRVLGARENNLKNISVSIPRHKFTVITGLSGSGKSSLALDTIYAEGIRRYVECLSTYARQFLERVDRPDMDDITGLPPVIAIERGNHVKNSRSTVGTTTEIYDYLRLLFAKIGKIHCPRCDREITRRNPENIAHELIRGHAGERAYITYPAPAGASPKGLLQRGFARIYSGGETVEIETITDIPEGAEVVVDRVQIKEGGQSRITDSLEAAMQESRRVNARIVGGGALRFSRDLECLYCGVECSEPTPLLFSFNSPEGACAECRGFGNRLEIDPSLIAPNGDLSLSEGAIEPFEKPSLKYEKKQMLKFAEKSGIDVKAPFKSLPQRSKELIFGGSGGFPGVRGVFKYLEEKSYKMHVRVFLSKYRSAVTCHECRGSRLKPEALRVRVGGRNIYELCGIAAAQFREFLDTLKLGASDSGIAGEVLKQIVSRADFLVKVGLGYVTLSRLTKTLSGGEAQRVSLACQLGGSLTDTLYIMDEPSIGLHARDISRLVGIIKELQGRGNTVVVVEHDFEMIRAADYLIELGPKAGEGGGDLVFQGTIEEFTGQPIESATKRRIEEKSGAYPQAKRRKIGKRAITVVEACENNLKNITVSFPLGALVCVTGVSGSGKSTLVEEALYANLARKLHGDAERVGSCREIRGASAVSDAVMLDQSPIGRSSRSNPVTYIKAYDDIRKLMAESRDAKHRKLTPSHFSFNVPGGRCDACEGEGRQKIEMQFLADVFITCEECGGKRFKPEALEVKYKGRSIDDALSLTVDEASEFFSESPALRKKLKALRDVGLGYLRLGQAATTLSGGEAQRIKVARELARKDGCDILYILDEPTVGLHAEDVSKLLEALNKLIDAGNSVILVEHNLEVIRSADYVIDLGPEGGEAGGYIVAEGTPDEVATSDTHTGKYLKAVISG
ncbi:MAG: excinuclease ABC subunit UvrA [Deltaproteobacteria bacterium]